MERRFYLRGLGLGIAVTAVIMGIITSRGNKMTDREIIARAKELGMVENTVLSESNDGAPEDMDQPGAADHSADAAAEESVSKAVNAEGDAAKAGVGDTAREDNADETDGVTGNGDVDGEKTSAGADDAEQDENQAKEENDDITASGDSDEQSGETDEESENPGDDEVDARELITSAAVKTITVNSGDGSHTVAQKLADAGVVTSAENFDEFLCQNGYDKKLRTGTFSIPADASDEQIARIVTGAE